MESFFRRVFLLVANTAKSGVKFLEKLIGIPNRIVLLEDKIVHLQAQSEYLLLENSRLASQVRYFIGKEIYQLPTAGQTRSSFDFQWDKLPPGRFNLENNDFRKEAAGYVCEFTNFRPEWFQGKKVIDVGCGAGRYSWAMCSMGAEVLSIDQSPHGLERTAKVCRDFPSHRTKRVDLLEPLNIDETFDLVWSFGVLHHTGDTYGAFKAITHLVRPDGYIFLMLYGEPRKGLLHDFQAVNEYESWRIKTRNMEFNDKLDFVIEAMKNKEFTICGEEQIEGYFDAISPAINDLYSWHEIETWLLSEGFTDIQRTVESRNHHVMARKLN